MKVATKELMETLLLNTANKDRFSVISKNRSFALTDDIIRQSIEESPDGKCQSIDVYQIIDTIWRDTKEGRIYGLFTEGRRYEVKPDLDGNIPNFVSRATPALHAKPKRVFVFNIDNGKEFDMLDFTTHTRLYDADPDSTQRMLDYVLAMCIEKACKNDKMEYNPEIKALCDKFCVEQEESGFKVPQRIESQSAADYILRFRNDSIEYREIPVDENSDKKNPAYFNAHPKFYIGVSATDDATPDKGDIKNALDVGNNYFEMYKRIGHREYETDLEDIYCELYEGACYNIVDGLLGQKAVKIQKKVPSVIFSYTNSGDFFYMNRVKEEPIENNEKEIERTLDGMANDIVGPLLMKEDSVHYGELMHELYNTNEHRVPGCQWSEDILAARRRQMVLESELEREQ